MCSHTHTVTPHSTHAHSHTHSLVMNPRASEVQSSQSVLVQEVGVSSALQQQPNKTVSPFQARHHQSRAVCVCVCVCVCGERASVIYSRTGLVYLCIYSLKLLMYDHPPAHGVPVVNVGTFLDEDRRHLLMSIKSGDVEGSQPTL